MTVQVSAARAAPQSTASHAGEKAYEPFIDGMRAIAILLVVLYHAGTIAISSGFVGVDVFFVLSGYLIGGLIFRELDQGRFSLRAFYSRRLRRIAPALIVVVTTTWILGWFMLRAEDLKELGSVGALALTGLSNIKFWLHHDYFAPDTRLEPLLMTWSLGVEEQFYLFFPGVAMLLVALQRRWRITALACLCVVSFILYAVLLRVAPSAAFYLIPARAWELGVGALLALVRTGASGGGRLREFLTVAGLVLIVLAGTVFGETEVLRLIAVTTAVAGTAIVLFAGQGKVSGAVLASPPMRFVGLVSYSWYLWHWPLMAYLRIVNERDPSYASMLGAAVVAFGLGVLTWWFVETPFRKRVLSTNGVLVRYALVGLVAVAPLAMLRLTNGWPARLPPAVAAIESAVERGRGNCLATYGETAMAPDCVAGAKGAPTIAVIGDSHAASLEYGLQQIAGDQNMRLLAYSKSACPPLVGITFHPKEFPTHARECAQFMQASFKSVAENPDVKVVFLAAFWDYGSGTDADQLEWIANGKKIPSTREALTAGLPPLLDLLHKAGKVVVVVGDIQDVRMDPVRARVSASMPVRKLVRAISGAPPLDAGVVLIEPVKGQYTRNANAELREIVKAFGPGAAYLGTAERFCKNDFCRYAQGADLLYFDHGHLTTTGSEHALAPAREMFAHEPATLITQADWHRP